MTATDTPFDPLSGAGFDALYTQQIAPALQELEADRKKAVVRTLLMWAATLAVLGVEAFLTHSMTGQSWVPNRWIWITTLIGGAGIGYLPLLGVASRAKKKVIQTLCTPMGVTYTLAPDEPPVFQRLTDLTLLPKNVQKNFEDMFEGTRRDCKFMLCEATLTQGDDRSKRTVFQGQLFQIAFSQRFLGKTVLMRDAGWLNRFTAPQGLRKVGLEDPQFEKIWEVFADDQIESRAILTPVFMEQLIALEKAYQGKNIRCAFFEGDLMIAVEGKDRFEMGNMFTPINTRAKAESLASDISAVMRLIDTVLA